MYQAAKIEDGAGVEAVLLIDGAPVRFKVAIVARKGFRGKSYEYGWISEDGSLYSNGFYSGGSTGFGRSERDLISTDSESFKEEYEVITTNLEEVIRFGEQEEQRREKEHQEWLERQQKRVVAINQLPTRFELGNMGIPGACFWIKRGEATFNPSYSRQIKYGVSIKYSTPDRPTEVKDFWVENYFTEDGKVQTKKFTEDLRWLFGFEKGMIIKDPKQFLLTLKGELQRAQKVISVFGVEESNK